MEQKKKKKKCLNDLIPQIHRENIFLLAKLIRNKILKTQKNIKMAEYLKVILRLLKKKTDSIPGIEYKRYLIESLLDPTYNFGIKDIKSLVRKEGFKLKKKNNIKILEKIGEGSYGEAYFVEYNGNECVMKIQTIENFFTNIKDNIQEIKRIADEVNIQKKFKGLNVTPIIYDNHVIVNPNGFLEINIIMEYCGISLKEWLKYNKLNKSHINQLKKKLEIIHNHNIAHFDIHSENILVKDINNKTEFYYIDFGISADSIKDQQLNIDMLDTTIKSKNRVEKNIIYDILIEFGLFC